MPRAYDDRLRPSCYGTLPARILVRHFPSRFIGNCRVKSQKKVVHLVYLHMHHACCGCTPTSSGEANTPATRLKGDTSEWRLSRAGARGSKRGDVDPDRPEPPCTRAVVRIPLPLYGTSLSRVIRRATPEWTRTKTLPRHTCARWSNTERYVSELVRAVSHPSISAVLLYIATLNNSSPEEMRSTGIACNVG